MATSPKARAKTSSRHGFQLGGRPRLFTGLVLGLAVLLFFAVNIFFGLKVRTARLDLTENNLYTVSAGTQEILGSLKEPVTLRLYYTERVANQFPALRLYGARVRELVEAFTARADGMIDLAVIAPEAYSEAEDLAEAQGVRGVDTQTGEKLYLGLVGTNTVGQREVIPFFAQERAEFLEYDLAALIDNLARMKKPVLGMVSSLPLGTGYSAYEMGMSGRSQNLAMSQPLRDRFEIAPLPSEFESVPDNIDVLMIAHPPALSPRTLYAIDQFVLGGGRALVFVDPLSELSQIPGPGGQPLLGAELNSDLAPLLAAWGVGYETNKVVADLGNAQLVSGGRGERMPTSSFVLWYAIRADSLNAEDPVSAEVQQINLGTAGYLVPREGRSTTVTPLITSTANSMLLDVSQVRFTPAPQELLRQFVADPERYVIAARITGPAKTAYPEGQPPKDEDADTEESDDDIGLNESEGEDGAPPEDAHPQVTESAGPINVIVVADTDIFDDRFWVDRQSILGQQVSVPIADNASFVVNAVENLMGSSGLIALRGRSRTERNFDVVENLRRQAQANYLTEEEALKARLEERQQRLDRLQGGENKTEHFGTITLTPEQQAEIDQARREIYETRAALREVQRSLRSDIESLGTVLKFINIGLMPIIVGSAAVGLAFWRRRRRHRASGTGAGP